MTYINYKHSFKRTEILLSLLFFFFYTGQGTWLAFLNLYLENKGMSGTQIGIIGGVYQAAIFLFVPLLGILGDNYGIKKLAIIASMGSTVLLYFFQFIDQYVLLITYTLLMASFIQPLGSLFDSLAIAFVKNENRSSFGQLRVWGSIGWATSTYVMGMFIAHFDINYVFTIASIISIITLIILFLYNNDAPEAHSRNVKLNKYKFLFQNKVLIIFYLILIVYGISVAPIFLFINLYFKELGAGYNMVGVAFSIMALSEIPFFFFGNRFVKQHGPEFSIIISLVVTLIRMVLYSIIKDPYQAIFVGLGQGFTFSLFLVAVVDYVHDKIPSNLRATGQSLIWASHFGIGITVGNILTGNIYDTIGIKSILLFDALFIIIITVGFYNFFKFDKKQLLK